MRMAGAKCWWSTRTRRTLSVREKSDTFPRPISHEKAVKLEHNQAFHLDSRENSEDVTENLEILLPSTFRAEPVKEAKRSFGQLNGPEAWHYSATFRK